MTVLRNLLLEEIYVNREQKYDREQWKEEVLVAKSLNSP